ncbi:MAG: sulfatase-like hydrolase/transferase [Candidatus Sumerlaeota bacterium]
MAKPNVIFFFTDQQRWDTSGLFGNPMNLTPNFDRMAREGTHCYNAFTNQPVCLPARTLLQTGKYASRADVFNNGGYGLPKDEKSLGHFFRDAGYTTAYIGKWHMGHEDHGPVPPERRTGYDYFLGANVLEFTSDDYETYMYDTDGKKVFLPGYRVDAQTDAAIRYISGQQEQPFFLMLSYLEPHFQNTRDDYPAPEGYEELFQDPWTPPDLKALRGSAPQHLPGYYGIVKRLDEALGRLRDALRSMGMLDNTIILYTADHGCHFKTRNGEYKRSCHDGSLRIPMAFSGPGFEGGGCLKQMTSLIDVPPTLLDACGIEVPEDMDGNPITRLVQRRADDWPEDIFSEICNGAWLSRAVRTRRWKYSVRATSEYPDNEGHPDEYEEDCLYDLKADPWELNNLAGCDAYRKVADVMKERLMKRLGEVGETKVTIKDAEPWKGGQKFVKDEEAYL